MNQKPLIALLTNNDDDVYCFRLELIRAIIDAGYSLLISCPDGPKFEMLEEQGLVRGTDYYYDDPFIDRRGTSVINDWRLMKHYRRLFKQFRPAVVLTYTAKPNVYASIVASKLRIPVINNVTGLGSVLHKSGLKRWIIMNLFKFAYRKSYCIMFQNATNMEFAKKSGWIKGNYKLIPGSGVALGRFPLQDYPEGGNGAEGEPIVFNYIGRIMQEKGVNDYIEVAKRIKAKYPQTEFNMLGFIEQSEMHYQTDLEELEAQGIVYYRGSQKDVRPWIARSHVIIHPSTYGEGISNVLLENAASGRPIITTDNPGCKETVADGVSGYIYHGKNIDELERLIDKFVSAMSNDDRQQMGLEGRKVVEESFDRRIVINAYLTEIGRVAPVQKEEVALAGV